MKADVFVIVVKEGKVVPIANSWGLLKKIRQARLWVGEDMGHRVLFEDTREVASEIEFFLEG